jgi:hypothetical protein
MVLLSLEQLLRGVFVIAASLTMGVGASEERRCTFVGWFYLLVTLLFAFVSFFGTIDKQIIWSFLTFSMIKVFFFSNYIRVAVFIHLFQYWQLLFLTDTLGPISIHTRPNTYPASISKCQCSKKKSLRCQTLHCCAVCFI